MTQVTTTLAGIVGGMGWTDNTPICTSAGCFVPITSHKCCMHARACAQVWPICGDGLELEIRHTAAATGRAAQLMLREITPDAKDKPARQKVKRADPCMPFKATSLHCPPPCPACTDWEHTGETRPSIMLDISLHPLSSAAVTLMAPCVTICHLHHGTHCRETSPCSSSMGHAGVLWLGR